MKKQILFITRGKDDPSTRYRVSPLIVRLKEQGWSAHQIPRHSRFVRSRILLAALAGQTIFIQRKLFGLAFLALLTATKPRIIFDFDDAIFVKRSGKSSKRNQARFRAIIRAASLVIAGNPFLAQAASAQGGRGPVMIAPTSVISSKYTSASALGKPCDLVWIGSSSTRKYLDQAYDSFTEIGRRCPGITLKIISDFQWDHPSLNVICIPWADDTEIGELKSCQIGIAPMPNDEWTRGKCALKVIQYMAAGLPVVASNAGINAKLIEQGLTGLIAETPEEWAQSVNELLNSPELRVSMGDAAQRCAQQDYNLDTISRETAATMAAPSLRTLKEAHPKPIQHNHT